MRGNYTKQEIIDILWNKISISPKLIDSSVVRSLTQIPYKKVIDIVTKKIPPNKVNTEELVAVYTAYSIVVDGLPPASEFFLNEELDSSNRSFGKLTFENAKKELEYRNPTLINLERKARFIFECFGNYDYKSRKTMYTRIAHRYAALEEKYGTDFCELSRKEIIEYFKGLTTSSFYSEKHTTLIYFKWCHEKGLIPIDKVDEVSSISYKEIDNTDTANLEYFDSFKEIMFYYNKVRGLVENVPKGFQVPTDHAIEHIIKPALILSWLGFNIPEMVKILYSDLIEDTRSIVCNAANKNILSIEDNIFKELPLRPDEEHQFLIHREERFQECDLPYFRHCLTLFNSIANHFKLGKIFKLKKIRSSGNFFRMYQYEHERESNFTGQDYEIINKLCFTQKYNVENISVALLEYRHWKKMSNIERS